MTKSMIEIEEYLQREKKRGFLNSGVGLIPKCEASILEPTIHDFLKLLLYDWMNKVSYRQSLC